MSLYPLMLEGSTLRALIVGGGEVAARKARALLEAGAQVRIVAPAISDGVRALSGATIIERAYASDDIGDASLVVAATSSREVNARVARDARSLGRLANVADAPAEGNCVTPATHRAGDLVIAVSAGGIPTIAARVRDAIATRYSADYANAVATLGALRAEMLAAGQRERWTRVAENVIGENFCDDVERGQLGERVRAWR